MCPCVGINMEVAVCGFINTLKPHLCDQSCGCLLCTSLQACEVSILPCSKASSLLHQHTCLAYQLSLDRFLPLVQLMVLCFCLLPVYGLLFSLDIISR